MNLNLETKPCENCSGTMSMSGHDGIFVNYTCDYCGHTEKVPFQSEKEAQFYMDTEKREHYIRLREGLLDWEATNWYQLHKDIEGFINKHHELRDDLQFQMALVACLTKGYHQMDYEKYKQCKSIFKKIDKIYKARLKDLKAQSKKLLLSDSMTDYRTSRVKYIGLRNEFLRTKTAWKLVWKLAKFLFNKI